MPGRRDDLAAQVAANIQHAQRLGELYRTAAAPELDAETLREQLVEAASYAGPAAAAIYNAEQAQAYVVRLHGLAVLASRLRQALHTRGANG
jgi:hypothetical protein